MRNVTYIALALLLLVSVLLNIYQYKTRGLPARTDTVETVRWDTVHDPLPPLKGEKVIKYIKVPCSSSQQDSLTTGGLIKDSDQDSSITLPVVQKKYSDDSTYTAYVSGVEVDPFPRLDSIITRQRTLERIVTRTVYMKKGGLSIKVRPAVTAGYDPVHGSWGVMAGVAVVPDW